MGCGSSTDTQNTKNAPAPPFTPFTEFPTPRLLAQAQKDYTKSKPSQEPLDHPDVDRGKNVPKPFPPPTSKVEVFKAEEHEGWDARTIEAPEDLAFGPLQKLVDYLVKGAKNEIAKVRAFYVWIACHKAENYDLDRFLLNPTQCPLYTLLLVRAEKYSYNDFFENMCKCAGIPCLMVNRGGVKGAGYMHGEPVAMWNDWCLVYVDKAWRFVDQHFGSFSVSNIEDDWELLTTDVKGYKAPKGNKRTMHFKINEDYFLTDPERFIFNHYTDDPAMQLLARPVTKDEFQQMVRLYSPYFDHGFMDLSEPHCKLVNETGEVEFSFDLKPNSLLKFKYAIFKHMGGKAKGNIDGEDLKNFVLLENKGDKRVLRMRFKRIGLYKIEVMVLDLKDETTWYWLASYVVRCNRPYFNLNPLPSIPDRLQELGPGADWRQMFIRAQQQGGIIRAVDGYAQLKLLRDSNDEEVEYRFQLDSRQVALHQLQFSHLQDVKKKEVTLHLKLPSHGNYLLQALTRAKGMNNYKNTCNYLVVSEHMYMADLFPADRSLDCQAGAVAEGKNLLKPISHPQSVFDVPSKNQQNTETPDTSKDGTETQIEMQTLADLEIEAVLTMYDNESEVDYYDYFWVERQGDKLKFLLRFPEAGTYKLQIYTRPTGSQSKKKESWRYLIDVYEPTSNCVPFPTMVDWSQEFKLISPKFKTLEENTQTKFEVQVPGAEAVFLEQPNTAPVQLERNGDTYKGLMIPQLGDLSLHARFKREAYTKHLLTFQVVTADTKAHWDREQQDRLGAAMAKQRRLETEKATERKRAEDRKRAADEKAERERLDFEQHKEELFAEEARLEKEAVDEHAREVAEKERELAERQKKLTGEQADDIIKNEVEDAKKEQNAETQRRRDEFNEMEKQLIRERMRQATKFGKKERLDAAIAEFEQARLDEEDGDHTQAKKTLAMLEIKERLVTATQGTDLDALYYAINDVKNEGLENQLPYEMGEAYKRVDQLRRLKKRKYRVLGLTHQTMQELRGYQHPSPEVHQIIQATLLLLGENESRTKNWKDCQRQVKTIGEKPILRLMQNFNPEEVNPQIAARVEEILQQREFSKVRLHSAGAAAMYVWMKSVLESIDDKSGPPASVEEQKEILSQPDESPLTPSQWARFSLSTNSNNGPTRL